MSQRTPVLQSFLDHFETSILTGEGAATEAVHVASRIFEALRARTAEACNIRPARLPVCAHFDPAIAHAREASVEASGLAFALAELEPSLHWVRRNGAGAHGEAFAEGHANTMIVGPHGLEKREDISVGISLLAPNVTYPDHRHPPEEVYSVLSSGDWRRDGGDWFAPGIGGIVYNSPGITHAMRSGAQPLLAAWCLWSGR